MANSSNIGGKNKEAKGKFFDLVVQTQCMSQGLQSSNESKVFKAIDDIAKAKKMSEEDVSVLKNKVIQRAKTSEAILDDSITSSFRVAEEKIDQVKTKGIKQFEKTLANLEKRIDKLSK